MCDFDVEFVVTLNVSKPITTCKDVGYEYELLQEYVNVCYGGYYIREIVKSSIERSPIFIDIHMESTQDVKFVARCIRYSMGDVAFGVINADSTNSSRISTLNVLTPLGYKAIITMDSVYAPRMGIPICIISEPYHKPMNNIIEAVGTGFSMSTHFNRLYEFDGTEVFAPCAEVAEIERHKNWPIINKILFSETGSTTITKPGIYSLVPGIVPRFKPVENGDVLKVKMLKDIVNKKYVDMCLVINNMLSFYQDFSTPEAKACLAIIKS